MTTGVALLTYGSARDKADVPAYMTRVRQGRTPPDDLVAEFQRRYALIGGSPLVPITERLAAALERALGEGFVVEAGMRFSEPSVAQAVGRLAERGAEQIVGLILAPQYSPIIMGQYNQQLEAAAAAVGRPWRMVGSWHLHPRFVAVLAERLRAGLDRFPAEQRDGVAVLMTAHSLPKRVVDREPGYIDMLKATADAVASQAGLPRERWHFAYQSAGHSPEEWLKPDMLDVLPELARAGHRAVLLAPVQFVADHLETLFDIDIAGREQAEEAGVERFARVPAPNDSAEFAAALAEIVRAELSPA
jgi:ferrochelatase